MNTEKKFRAWDEDMKTMRTVTCIRFYDEYMYCDEGNSGSYTRLNIIDTPLMQYTGLKDKNGKDRCEGDIIRRCTGYIFEEKKMFFSLGGPNNAQAYGYDFHPDDEIIGNIYEHPDLLHYK